MSNIYEEMSMAHQQIKKLQRDLDAIVEAALQKPADAKTQERIEYLKRHKEAKEKKNDTEKTTLEEKKDNVEQSFDIEIEALNKKKEMMEEKIEAEISAIQKKKEMMEAKFDSQIEAIKQKKEAAVAKMELKINELNNCTTITYYENELKRLFDDIGTNRVKTQVEIRKEKELEDLKKRFKELEDYERSERAMKALFDKNKELTQQRYAREAELAKQEAIQALEWDKQIRERNPVPHCLDDEPDYFPEPENEIVHT